MVVAFVLARMQSGNTETSTTRNPSNPRTWQYWSKTAIGSESGPILQVPEICWVVVTLRNSHWSRVSSETRSSAVGVMHSSIMSL